MFVDDNNVIDNRELDKLVAPHNDEAADTLLQAELDLQDDESVEANLPRHHTTASHDGALESLDSIQAYLNEIGRVSLLTAAEEVELAERIARGVAAKQRLEVGEALTPRLR